MVTGDMGRIDGAVVAGIPVEKRWGRDSQAFIVKPSTRAGLNPRTGERVQALSEDPLRSWRHITGRKGGAWRGHGHRAATASSPAQFPTR